MTGTELDELIIADGAARRGAALRAWLLDHHTASPGVWLALTRKGGSVTTLTWQQAVDEALCLAAIAADPAAQALFEVLTRTNRFALINRVNAVKRAETRNRKIAEYVAMLSRDETLHPQRARPADPPAP